MRCASNFATPERRAERELPYRHLSLAKTTFADTREAEITLLAKLFQAELIKVEQFCLMWQRCFVTDPAPLPGVVGTSPPPKHTLPVRKHNMFPYNVVFLCDLFEHINPFHINYLTFIKSTSRHGFPCVCWKHLQCVSNIFYNFVAIQSCIHIWNMVGNLYLVGNGKTLKNRTA